MLVLFVNLFLPANKTEEHIVVHLKEIARNTLIKDISHLQIKETV